MHTISIVMEDNNTYWKNKYSYKIACLLFEMASSVQLGIMQVQRFIKSQHFSLIHR